MPEAWQTRTLPTGGLGCRCMAQTRQVVGQQVPGLCLDRLPDAPVVHEWHGRWQPATGLEMPLGAQLVWEKPERWGSGWG